MKEKSSETYPKLSEVKNWSPEVEKEITAKWKRSKRFEFDIKTKKKIYSIDTPPPYINSPIHIGHAVTYSYMDFFARYKRMKGFEVLFPLGLDRNGLPIELGAEKKFNVSPFSVSREEFLGYCKKLLEETSEESTDSFAKLGISFNSYSEGEEIGSVYLTDSSDYRALTQATFVSLYKKGKVYEDSRINNWDPKLRTTIADSEIEYKDVDSFFNDVKWKIKETGEEVVIGTTRPELICSCGMVIYNPEDKRYKHLAGKTAITPLFGKEVPIKAHPLAQIDKGTGLVMMCSAGDLSDIQFFREMKLAPIISINQDGKMNSNAGFLEGLKVREAREKTIQTLKEKNLLVKQTKISHRTPISERSKAEVEFIEMPEFYLKQLEVKKDLKKIINKLNFYPDNSKKILDDWIEAVSIDWPISRRRYYATEIPLWHYEENLKGKIKKFVAIPLPGRYHQPWKEKVPKDAEVYEIFEGQLPKKIGVVKDFDFSWTGETRVFDTWFDSSISELFISGYSRNLFGKNSLFEKIYPVTLRPQGKEIVRTWLYYTLLRGYLETGKLCFEDAWIHQHILDDKGRKMSKSLGNTVDPQEILRDYGAEALRLWSAFEGDISKQDLSCSKERIKAEVKTLTKILNLSRFILQFEKPSKKPKLTDLDKLFIDYVEDLTKFSDECYDIYDFYNPVVKLRHFLWEIFSSHYLEIVKSRAYNQEKNFSDEESNSAKFTLHFLLERFLILVYPVIPQVTCFIANEKGIDLIGLEFPKANVGNSDLNLVEKIMEFNSMVWKIKKEKGISLRDSVSDIKIPKELKAFENDLKSAHNLA